VRLLKAWQAVSRLARKGAALGLVFLALLPSVSTADDFHTCALRGFAAQYRSQQLYENSDDNSDQAPCLACYWQSVTDPAYDVDQLWVEFHPLCSLPVAQHAITQPGTHPVRHGRAPPWLVLPN
jgi:hypothetical protein